MTAMRTSEVLNRAADLIEERGWTTGNSGMLAQHNTPLCLEGGIAAATGTVQIYTSDLSGHTLWSYGDVEACPAYAAVRNYLQREPWKWNDYYAGSASEVIEVLRAVALVEAAKEDEALAAEFIALMASPA